MRRSGATSLGISVMTKSEMLYGALLRTAAPALLAETRSFFSRVDVFNWDEYVAEFHARVRADATASGRSAGTADIMIAAHALALWRKLVTSDQAIHSLGIKGLKLADWST